MSRVARFVSLVVAVGLLMGGRASAAGPAFEIDETHGVGGVARLALGAYDGPAPIVLVRADRKVLVVHAGVDGTSAVTRLTADGLMDPTFGDGGRRWIDPEPTSSEPVTLWTALQDGNGRILVSGTSGFKRFAARLEPDGAMDPSFGTGGFALDSEGGPGGLTLLADGGLLLTSYVHAPTQYDLRFTRLTSTGAVDRTFGVSGSKILSLTGPDGAARLENVGVAAVLPDGRLLLAGALSRLEGGGESALLRLTPAGDLDPTFGVGGVVLGGWDHVGQPDAFSQLVLLPDGRFVVKGGTTTDQFVARYDAAGRRDPTWGSSMPHDGSRGDGRIDWTSPMVPDGDGWLVAGTSSVLARTVPALMRLTGDGRPDPSFGYRSTRLFDLDPKMAQSVTGLATIAGGGLILTATTHPGGSGADVLIARLRVPPQRSGYWMLGEDGKVYPFGEARHYGDGLHDRPQVDLEPTPSGKGYWVLAADGSVGAFGDARHWGSPAYGALGSDRAASLSATPSGNGYWIFTGRGQVIPFGDAQSFGDLSTTRLNGGVLDSVATPSGLGYYMVASDGGIFAFGDAAFAGSMGGKKLNAPVQSLVPDSDGKGYWLVASDGGIFAFDAPFRGSMGGQKLNKPVSGMVRYGDGYLMVGTDGGIFNFSSSPFAGSLGDKPPASPVVAVAALP